MTIKHRLKLFPARIRWVLQALVDSQAHNKVLADFDHLKALHSQVEQDYLRAQRYNPTAKDTYILEGKHSLLTELLSYGHRQEGQAPRID